ncbi:MAG: hypothetical protein ACFFDI_27810 [Promethearchaeota archaeon]
MVEEKKHSQYKEYFEKVVSDIEYLWDHDIEISEIGKLRSVLKCVGSDHTMAADPFFCRLQEFYISLSQMGKNLIFSPHYPCAIDILPSKDKEYQIVISTLPGSLADSDPNDTKMSLSMRIYPVGVASLRLGWFLSTGKNFKIEDIIDFLWKKETDIQIGKEILDIDKLSVKYAKTLISGLIEKKRPPFLWSDTYNIIDIIEPSDLPPLEQCYNSLFLPLLTLQKNAIAEKTIGTNLSRKGDVLLVGSKSAVSYFPSGTIWDRRKVRRWLRNFIELFAVQQYLITEINTAEIAETFRVFKKNWMNTLKRGILPYEIRHLFSLWIYTQLHQQPCTLEKEDWRNRYLEFLKILDRDKKIEKANSSAWNQLASIKAETNAAEKSAGKLLTSVIETVMKAFKK